MQLVKSAKQTKEVDTIESIEQDTIIDVSPKTSRLPLWKRATKSPEETVQAKLDKIEHNAEATVKWDHRTGNLLVVSIAIAAMLGMAPDAVLSLASGHVSVSKLLPVIVSFIVVLGANRALISAAGDIRYHHARHERVPLNSFFVLYSVMLIEAVSFHYMLSVFSPATSTTIALLDWARAVLLPYVTMYLEQRIVKPIDPKLIATQSEIGQGIGVMHEVVRLAYNRSIPLALKLQNYRAVADLTPDMDIKLARMTRAAMAIQTYLATGEIVLIEDTQVVLLDRHGKPLALSGSDTIIDSTQEAPKPTMLERIKGKAKGKIKVSKRASTDSNRDAIVSELVDRLRAGDDLTNKSVAKMYTLSTSTTSAYINQAKAIVSASKPQPKPVNPPVIGDVKQDDTPSESIE